MFLEAVTVCVNYPDFLSAVIANNLAHLDHWIIVTDETDVATQYLVRSYMDSGKITLLTTNVFYENGATFNKGAGVNEGLHYRKGTSSGSWMMHLDGDIWLPPGFRNLLEKRALDPTVLYGLDRLGCTSYEDWQQYLAEPVAINNEWCLVLADAFPLMSRVAHYTTGEGYLPAGFLQLWNPAITGVLHYPTDSDGADRTDIQFSQQFSCLHRQLLPDTFCIHLESEPVREGSNWWGRRTPPFLPKGMTMNFGNQLPAVALEDLLLESSELASKDKGD